MIKRMAAVLAVVVLGGCLGKPGPVEEYLRVSPLSERCERMEGAAGAAGVGIKRFDTAEALDRQAVMLAKGRVMSPSLRWYWEAAPGRMLEQGLAGALNCTEGLAAVTPVRSGSDVRYSVTGLVTGFTVQEESMAVEVSAQYQLWEGSGGKPVGAAQFISSQALARLDAPSIADAGARAVSEVSGAAAAWVRVQAAGKGAK